MKWKWKNLENQMNNIEILMHAKSQAYLNCTFIKQICKYGENTASQKYL